MGNKKENASKSASGYKPNHLQWINPTPNTEDVQSLENNSDGFVELMFDFFDDVQEDERVSIKRDPQSSRWLAILFAGVGDSRNTGCALSVRGATPYDALILLAYFHSIRYEGEYPASADSSAGRWG